MSDAREACALFGIYAPARDVSRITYYGLFALQHRGQESSGIAVSQGEHIVCKKDMGLVNQVFDEDTLRLLKGTAAIGHNRYSTTGSSTKLNAQPMVFDTHFMRRRALAIVTAKNTDARLATADNSGMVLTLPAGSEIKILSARGDWIYALLPNDLRGWMPAKNAERVRLSL